MSECELKFIIFGNVFNGYWWRLRSVEGKTVEFSKWRYRHKDECEREVCRLRADRYPGAKVRDASIG